MVRLIAKMETSVTLPRTKSSANVPMMAMIPIASGSRAATMLPKTSRSSTRVSGTAMASARTRSSPDCVPISLFTAAPPPAWTVNASLYGPV